MLILALAYADIGVDVFGLFRKTGLNFSFSPGDLSCFYYCFFWEDSKSSGS